MHFQHQKLTQRLQLFFYPLSKLSTWGWQFDIQAEMINPLKARVCRLSEHVRYANLIIVSFPHLKAGHVWWAIMTKPLPIAVVRVAPYDYHLILGVEDLGGWRTSIAALDWISYALSISSRLRDIDWKLQDHLMVLKEETGSATGDRWGRFNEAVGQHSNENILLPHVIDVHGLQHIIKQNFWRSHRCASEFWGSSLQRLVYEESENGSLSDSDSDASHRSSTFESTGRIELKENNKTPNLPFFWLSENCRSTDIVRARIGSQQG